VITPSDPTQPNSTQLTLGNVVTQLAIELSWVESGGVITLKTQLNSTIQKIASCLSVTTFSSSWVFRAITSPDPTQLNTAGQLVSWVTTSPGVSWVELGWVWSGSSRLYCLVLSHINQREQRNKKPLHLNYWLKRSYLLFVIGYFLRWMLFRAYCVEIRTRVSLIVAAVARRSGIHDIHVVTDCC